MLGGANVMRGEGPMTQGWGGGAHGKHLVKKGGYKMQDGAGAAQATSSVHAEGYRLKAPGGECTQNMPTMSVTLDVLKLSGWLKADAPCRVGRRA